MANWYTIKEIVADFKLSESTIRRAIKDGRLKADKVGGTSWRISKEALEDFVKNSCKVELT